MKRLSSGLFVLAFFVIGCTKAPVKAPSIDPANSAVLAIAEYDANDDGMIDKTEAKKSALDPKKGWDSDGDGAISAEEIQTRLEKYESMRPGLQSLACTVMFRGKELPDATVTFEPESFLGEAVTMGEGTTDSYGSTEIISPDIAKEDPTLRGVRCGLYKVKITHPKLDIPKRYNEDTTLFFELSPFENVLMPTFQIR